MTGIHKRAERDRHGERGEERKPPLRSATPMDTETADALAPDAKTPEGLQREPKGPINRRTGRR